MNNKPKTIIFTTAPDINDIKGMQEFTSDELDELEADYQKVYQALYDVSLKVITKNLRINLRDRLDCITDTLRFIHELKTYRACIDLGARFNEKE
jgi:hypothetical protein